MDVFARFIVTALHADSTSSRLLLQHDFHPINGPLPEELFLESPHTTTSHFLKFFLHNNPTVISDTAKLKALSNPTRTSQLRIIDFPRYSPSIPYSPRGLLEEIVIDGSLIEHFETEFLGYLPNLSKFSIINSFLRRIPNFSSHSPSPFKLRSINLSHNHISTYATNQSQLGPFTKLPSLESLFLTDNTLTDLNLVVNCPTLTHLDLSSNQLSRVSQGLGQLTALTDLRLSSNSLNSLPSIAMSNLRNLQSLYLSGNSFLTFPIITSTQLRQLYLDKNSLLAIPSDLSHLKYLSVLNLSHNKIAILPKAMANLVNLKELYLKKNLISEIPNWLLCLSKLQRFDLSENNLTVLGYALSQMPSLRSLDVSSNQLTALPPALGLLSELSEFKFHGNDLSFPPTEVLSLGHKAVLDFLSQTLQSR